MFLGDSTSVNILATALATLKSYSALFSSVGRFTVMLNLLASDLPAIAIPP